MLMQALQFLQFLKGVKDLVDSDEQSLVADHVETMVKNIGTEMEETVNQMITEDASQTFTDLKGFLKG